MLRRPVVRSGHGLKPSSSKKPHPKTTTTTTKNKKQKKNPNKQTNKQINKQTNKKRRFEDSLRCRQFSCFRGVNVYCSSFRLECTFDGFFVCLFVCLFFCFVLFLFYFVVFLFFFASSVSKRTPPLVVWSFSVCRHVNCPDRSFLRYKSRAAVQSPRNETRSLRSLILTLGPTKRVGRNKHLGPVSWRPTTVK